MTSGYDLLYFIIIIVLLICFYLARILYNRRSQLNEKHIILELRPPSITLKPPHATEHFIRQLHGLNSTFSWRDRLLGSYQSFSLEVVSTRSSGIRFLIRINEASAGVFKQKIASFLPGIRFKQVEDYIPERLADDINVSLLEFKQAGHFAYPLEGHNSLIEHDPIAYITGAMTKLRPNELVAYQLVLSPAYVRQARSISNKLLVGKEVLLMNKDSSLVIRLVRFIITKTLAVLELALILVVKLTGGSSDPHNKAINKPSPPSQKLIDSVQSKLGQPLFRANIRALVISSIDKRGKSITTAIAASFASYSVPGHQAIVTSSSFPEFIKSRYRAHSFAYRLPGLLPFNSNVFSASEVASLYHFPYGVSAKPENLAVSFSRTLAAPAVMKKRSDNSASDIVLGNNLHHGSTTSIGLTAAERERHVLILGGTGNGKTTMMQYAAVQDIRNGKGLAVVDPHGDMARTILKYIPEERLKDVVYMNPIDIDYPIGINLLELPGGLSKTQLLLEKDRVTEAAISVMRKVFSDDEANAHRIESLFRNAIRTAFTIEGATLFTVLKLLRNKAYRLSIMGGLEDEDLKDFWREEFGKAGDYQRVSMTKGITARMDRFNSSEPAKRMLGQAKSTINFEDIINSGKILICNLAEGELIEDTSVLIGTTILAKIKLAAERSIKMSVTKRRPFYLYVDEFQNFATTPFIKMLSGSRKYKLFLTIAQQTTAQQDNERLTEAILANVRTVVCFGSGSPADERILLPQFAPYIDEGELANLSAHNFYIRIRALEPMEPISGETLLLEGGTRQAVNRVIDISRNNYATKFDSKQPKKVTTEKPKGYIEVKPMAAVKRY